MTNGDDVFDLRVQKVRYRLSSYRFKLIGKKLAFTDLFKPDVYHV